MKNPMTATERMYRYQCALEEIQEIARRVMEIQERSLQIIVGDEHLYLERFHATLTNPQRHLEDAIAEARLSSEEQILAMQLQASLELIGRSPEKMRREQQ